MHSPEHRLRLKGYARTNTGKVRDNNEDSVNLWLHNDFVILAAVADGMGGAVAGEEASRLAIEAIETNFIANGEIERQPDKEGLIEHLKKTIIIANEDIVNKAADHPELKGMGTTITLALVLGTSIIVGHVGDSRAYLVDGVDHHITQITSDHSFVQALVAAGHITEEEAEEHPMRNVLYRALGQSRELEVDVYFETLHPGDRLILCSDGLTLHVSPTEIAELAMADADPSLSSQALIDLANERGGRDNVSAIVVKAEATDSDKMGAVKQLDVPFDEADTMMLEDRDPFGPSESSDVPETEHPDTHAALKHITGTFPAVSWDSENLAEGRDHNTPDQ